MRRHQLGKAATTLIVGVLFGACASLTTTTSVPVTEAPHTQPPASESAIAVPSTLRPTATLACVPTPTPSNPEPVHAPVNGVPDLGVPVLRGVILVQIAQCRDIAEILKKYGLTGPATRDLPDVTSPESATRWYRVSVSLGSEPQTVVTLHEHPEDIDYVQLIPVSPPPISTQSP